MGIPFPIKQPAVTINSHRRSVTRFWIRPWKIDGWFTWRSTDWKSGNQEIIFQTFIFVGVQKVHFQNYSYLHFVIDNHLKRSVSPHSSLEKISEANLFLQWFLLPCSGKIHSAPPTRRDKTSINRLVWVREKGYKQKKLCYFFPNSRMPNLQMETTLLLGMWSKSIDILLVEEIRRSTWDV